MWIAELFYVDAMSLVPNDNNLDQIDFTENAAKLFQGIKAIIDGSSFDIITKIGFTTALLRATIDSKKETIQELAGENRLKWRHDTRTELLYQMWSFARELRIKAAGHVEQEKKEAVEQVVQNLINEQEEAKKAYHECKSTKYHPDIEGTSEAASTS
ncbi:hypothetical protein JYU14_01420 [Simkania negevensis]|uniref:Uncharacterized protein n=1 Tax=Simkania negevensis TaxID=83561 RepID=A0ABS3AQZ2_9BACT|nr:hypothetical protein [Simkania negevensis]